MTYFVKTIGGAELFKSEKATTAKEAVVEAVRGGAYLGGADLRGADLRGAYLRGADLRGADLGDQWIIQGASRSDGYSFFLQKLKDDKEPMVRAGCRYLTLPDARSHWSKTRKGQKLLDETIAIIDCMVALAKIRGYMK